MSIAEILLIAIGLSFDTLAVSVTTGLVVNHIRFWQAVRIAVVLALFQGLMPLIGWYMGNHVDELLKDFDHWIAFVLLVFIGGRMVVESLKPEEQRKDFNPFKATVLLGMAISTSIDALAVGVTFAFINVDIVVSILAIGAITFIASMMGIRFGKGIGSRCGKRLEIIGGIVLIALGVKILVEHLYF